MDFDYLSELANKYESDKGTQIPNDGKHHGPRLNFTPIYNKYFYPLRNNNIKILEIGIGSGPSLSMWYQYFPYAEIHAIDIENSRQFDNDRVKTYVGDQSSRTSLDSIMNEIGNGLDIIIDDGGHMMGHQQITLSSLFKYLKSGGMYFIEDLHTSYWPYNGFDNLYGNELDINEDRSNTTINMIEKYLETTILESPFMTEDEQNYLTENIQACKLFHIGETIYGPNKLCLFTKK